MSSQTRKAFAAAYPDRLPKPLPDVNSSWREKPTQRPPSTLADDLRAKAVRMRDMAGWLLAEANELEVTAARMDGGAS